MKKIILIALFLSSLGYAQVGIGTTTPDPTTALDVNGVIRSSSLIPTLASGSKVYADPTGKLILFKDTPIMGKVNSNGVAASIYGATVTRFATGRYLIELLVPQQDSNYIIMLTNRRLNSGNNDANISYYNQTNTSFTVEIRNNDDGGGPGQFTNLEFMFKIN